MSSQKIFNWKCIQIWKYFDNSCQIGKNSRLKFKGETKVIVIIRHSSLDSRKTCICSINNIFKSRYISRSFTSSLKKVVIKPTKARLKKKPSNTKTLDAIWNATFGRWNAFVFLTYYNKIKGTKCTERTVWFCNCLPSIYFSHSFPITVVSLMIVLSFLIFFDSYFYVL